VTVRISLPQSWGKIRREPATRWFDDSFDAIPRSDERFARQYRGEPPPGFPLASPFPGIAHHLSGLNVCTLTLAFIGDWIYPLASPFPGIAHHLSGLNVCTLTLAFIGDWIYPPGAKATDRFGMIGKFLTPIGRENNGAFLSR